MGRLLAGTTAERLLHGAPCPVAVAPSGWHTRDAGAIRSIAVAYDQSDEARAALAGAAAMASALGARLRVVEVLEELKLGTPALMAGPRYDIPLRQLEERTRKHVAAVVAELPEAIAAEPVVGVGAPERVLAAESERVDLMVVGSRGYGPHRAVLLGSVSGRLCATPRAP